jgi:hypothetical protein
LVHYWYTIGCRRYAQEKEPEIRRDDDDDDDNNNNNNNNK